MKEEIVNSLDNPHQLERLYRSNEATFKSTFNSLYPELRDCQIARIWNERLNYEGSKDARDSSHELTFVIIASLAAGLVAKLPKLLEIDPDYFYPRNIAFAVLPLLILYFAWKQEIATKSIIAVLALLLASVVYINLLPGGDTSDTLMLACIHLPLFLWSVLGFTFVGGKLKNHQGRIDFLRYNGDLVVITTIILIAGVLLTVLTLALFSIIDVRIEEFYLQYVVVWGLAASPVVGTYFVRTNPQLVSKVSPMIAKIFTPLVLITLVAYLIAMISSGKDPYRDREFLLIFNILLIGVMALILFSVTETSKGSESKTMKLLLFLLSIVTVMVNGIALSAILFRILEWGITPNRLAVLGSNVLILTHLLIVTYRLYKTVREGQKVERVAQSIAVFLPVYSVWIVLVMFVFPLVFGFK